MVGRWISFQKVVQFQGRLLLVSGRVVLFNDQFAGQNQLQFSLVGGFNPIEKYWSKWESSPSRDEKKQCLKPPPRTASWHLLLTDGAGRLFFLVGARHILRGENVSFRGCSFRECITTWRIIPVSKWLVTSIYKPFSPFERGTTLLRGLTITMVINTSILHNDLLANPFRMSRAPGEERYATDATVPWFQGI